ncbi:MAG: metal ABC transporter substrate-binding protein [Candidatus Bipolaricaulaceae bacterium]
MGWRASVLVLAFVLSAWGDPLVVGTNPIVADIARQVAGDRVEVVSLIPLGTDPHGFEPSPKDFQILLGANLILAVGAGLEEHLSSLLDLPELRIKCLTLSEGLPLLLSPEGVPNPHLWLDPTLVWHWVDKIATAFSELFPEYADFFASRKAAYQGELLALHAWIQKEVEKIPPERRLLVTDHYALGYFAARYGFTEVGAIVPSESTLAEPSAQELAELIQKIRELRIPAIFVGPTFNPTLAEQVAQASGAQVVVLYLGTLTGPEGPAPSYLHLMRENVRRIVEALGG